LREGGARLASPEPLPVDSRVLLALEPERPDDPIRASGRVVWVAQAPYAERWHIGVAFDPMSKNTRAQLRRAVVRRQVGVDDADLAPAARRSCYRSA
jgi:hypothetical protein